MGEVRIIVLADDRSQADLDALVNRLDNVDRSGKRTTGTFKDFADSMAGGAREVEQAMQLMTRMDLVQISLQSGNDHLAAAQERYNQAVASYGPNSQEALNASRSLKDANDALDKAQLRAEASMALVVVSSLQMATTAIPAAIAALQGLTAAQGAAAISAGVLSATLTLGTAAIAITAGIIAIKTAIEGVDVSSSQASSSVARFEADLAKAQKTLAGVDKVQFTWEISEEDAIRDVEEATRGLQQAQQEAADKYIQNEQLKATLAGSNAEEIRRLRDEAAADLERQDALLRTTVGSAARGAAEAAKQADEERIRSADEALERIADDARKIEDANRKAADSTRAAWDAAFQKAGVNFSQFSDSVLMDMARIGDEQTAARAMKELEDRTAAMAAIERALATASGEARQQLLDQLAAVTDKTGEMYMLNRAAESGVLVEGEYADTVNRAAGELDGQTEAVQNASSAYEELQRKKGSGGTPIAQPAMALAAFTDARGNIDWAAMSRLNTGAGVDVTAVSRSTYAPRGQGFQNVGDIGSTDYGTAYGSRTLIHDRRGGMSYDNEGAQGGQVFNGGLVVNVYNPRNAQDVEDGVRSATTGAGTQTRGRTGARRS